MKRLLSVRTLALLALCGLVWSCSAPSKSTLAITYVTVIDATGAPPQQDMTVIIANQRIAALGPTSSIKFPDGPEVLNGAGKFLIPGLADMHVHLTGAGEPSGSRDFILPLLVANGITTVRDMGGNVEDLTRLRVEISSGAWLGPQISFTGPYLDGDPPAYQPSIVVKSASEARAAADRLAKEGVDFIKAQSSLNREAYFAIAEETKQLHIQFVGHVPDRVSALEASRAGQASIEHLTGILLACSSKEEELRRESLVGAPHNETLAQAHARERARRRKLLDTYSPQKAEALLHAFANNGTWQVPTFPILVHLAFVTPATNLLDDPRMKYVPQNERKIWNQGVKGQLEHYSTADFALREEIVRRSLEIVGKMQAAGVRIVAGTDIAAPNVFPGSSLHDDMVFLVEAGLTPMQALQAGTKDAAEFLGKLQTQGTIENGKLADLLLVDANPLDDIRNTKKIHALVLRGKLLDRNALAEILAAAEKFASTN
ncbi:MAG TPA: amidohydrolase family protein [Candidatus Acidoferrum sp.]|nr:amidohydrolase family protein [Candidatus Acidoferrum sp.]